MPSYQLTTLAREDLREVARYTLTKWGIKQARRYQAALENCFQAIGKNEIAGRTFIGRRSDLMVTRCEHHFVFFVCRDDKCPLILAVFHEKTDLMMRIRERLRE